MPDDIALSVIVVSPTGNIELQDPENGYELHGDSFASATYTHRKVETNGPWTQGTFATDSVLDNTTEALVVWVSAFDQYTFRLRVAALTAALDQLSFQVIRTIGNAQETWDCEVSDYTVETQQEFLTATQGVVRCQVAHRPAVPLLMVTPP